MIATRSSYEYLFPFKLPKLSAVFIVWAVRHACAWGRRCRPSGIASWQAGDGRLHLWMTMDGHTDILSIYSFWDYYIICRNHRAYRSLCQLSEMPTTSDCWQLHTHQQQQLILPFYMATMVGNDVAFKIHAFFVEMAFSQEWKQNKFWGWNSPPSTRFSAFGGAWGPRERWNHGEMIQQNISSCDSKKAYVSCF